MANKYVMVVFNVINVLCRRQSYIRNISYSQIIDTNI